LTSSGEHLQKNIASVYNIIDVSFDFYPPDTITRDTVSYKAAINALSPGDAVTIFTLDSTHFAFAKYAI